jgi:SAM-dependent methyltransferase
MATTERQGAPDHGFDIKVPVKRNKWERYELPEDMTGKSFLDVGCWEGINCAEAVSRGARKVVGVDLCTSRKLRNNVETFGFEFIQMDVLSEKWLELDDFDIVLCSGVLYHVENVISLLFRLRTVTRELLVLETATRDIGGNEPVMLFKPTDERDNPSNWWFPNRSCLREMVRSCGFDDPQEVFVKERGGGHRVCVHARPVERDSYERILPRKPHSMSLVGGDRDFADNRGKGRSRAGRRSIPPETG